MTLIGHLAGRAYRTGLDLVLSRVIPDRTNWLQNSIDADRVDGFIVIGQSDQSPVLDKVAGIVPPIVAWGAFVQGGALLHRDRQFSRRAPCHTAP